MQLVTQTRYMADGSNFLKETDYAVFCLSILEVMYFIIGNYIQNDHDKHEIEFHSFIAVVVFCTVYNKPQNNKFPGGSTLDIQNMMSCSVT
jgi:hypothetical protein